MADADDADASFVSLEPVHVTWTRIVNNMRQFNTIASTSVRPAGRYATSLVECRTATRIVSAT